MVSVRASERLRKRNRLARVQLFVIRAQRRFWFLGEFEATLRKEKGWMIGGACLRYFGDEGMAGWWFGVDGRPEG